MTKRSLHFALLIVCISAVSYTNKSEEKNRDPTEPELHGGGCVLPPSHLLDGAQPEASWIWDSGDVNPRNYYLHVRKRFSLNDKVKDARAFISAYAFAELYINGRFVDRIPTNPDPEFQTYEEMDLSPYLKEGINTIAALVYNVGEGLHHRMDARGGFFFQASIGHGKGAVTKVLSDSSWRVAQAVAWDTGTEFRQHHHCIGLKERYDARLAYEGWQESSFDDSDWEQAKEIGIPPLEPWNHMVVVRRERLFYETLEPLSEWNVKGYKVYDFGKEITAYPCFTITAKKAGVELSLGTGERLDKDRIPLMKDNVDYTDTYITKMGKQSWHPLTWRGFRYLAIKEGPDVRIDQVSGEFRSFPVQRTGSFSCSDEELNQIWETGCWTMQICAHDTWMDTPWREQTQYISGDTRYNIRYSAYAFAPNIKLLHDYNILSGAFSQRHSDAGAIRSRYPTGYHLGPATSTYIPDYQLEWILMLHEYHMYYNDAQLIKQVYPNLKKLLLYFEAYVSAERGLLGKVPGWVVLDHPDTYKQDVDGENTAVNCLYYGALNAAAWMARNIMDDRQKAAEWDRKAQNLKRSIQEYLWSEKDHAFKDGYESSRITQQTQVYALKYGLVPEEKKAQLVEFATSRGRSCEQSFSYWLLNTLFLEGEGQWALDYIRTNWGKQMNREDFNGAWYEMWESPPGMTKSHAWCSGPTALLPEVVMGLEPLKPGWKQFKVQPRLYDLEWAECVVPSVAGNISVKMRRLTTGDAETGLKIEAEIPEHTSSILYVPVQSSEHSDIYVNDRLIWKEGRFIETGNKISFDSESDTVIAFEFQAGSYGINVMDWPADPSWDIDEQTIKRWSEPYRGWHYHPGHVILPEPGIPGYEDIMMTDVPTVFQLSGDETWYMSFIGYDGKGYQSFIAESRDLVHWGPMRLAMGYGPEGGFDHGGVVLGAYLYEDYGIRSARVLKRRDGKYYSLYGAYPRQGGYELRPGYEGVAWSEDGLTWERAQDEPILSVFQEDCGSWEKDCIYQPWLLEHEGKYYNFYNAARGNIEQLGLATSGDLLNWERYEHNPVVRVGPEGSFNERFSSDAKVFRDQDHWVAFFFGVGQGGAHIMAAFSRDLYHWTVDPEPLYQAGGNPSGLDGLYAHKISLVWNPLNETYHMFYCAVDKENRRGIGLITSKPLDQLSF